MHSFLKKQHPDLENVLSTFARDGFIVFKPKISAGVLEAAASFTRSIIDICHTKTKSIPEGTDRHCGNYHQDRYDEVEVVKQLADNYHINAMLAVLHGAEPYPFQTLNYPQTSLARTHSDWVHFASEPTHLMSAAWIALEDVHPDAGPVFYVPGSHRFPVYTMQDFGLEPRESHKLNYAKYQDVMEAVVDATGSKAYRAVLKKGECLIWSSNLIHGGPPANKPELSRLSQVSHYFFKETSYNWAPVMSDVNKDRVVYYVQEQIEAKWRRKGESFKDTKGLSKLRIGTCSEAHPSPCAKLERMPEVMSTLLQHNVATGESIM
jgi:ectoine hydroxylase-related dioxygenase (phytanoyl-CoA dioxygenase family)